MTASNAAVLESRKGGTKQIKNFTILEELGRGKGKGVILI